MEATSHSPLLDKSVQPGIQLLDVKEEIKQTEINQVETNKDDEKKEPEIVLNETVFVSTKKERDICYLQFTINHISIDENYETRNAECLIDMIVKLYWLFDEADYEKYKSSQLSSKEKYDPSWEPEFSFYKATKFTRKRDPKEPYGVEKIEDFFGQQIVDQIPTKGEYIRLYIDDNHKKDESYFFCGRLHKIEKKEPELAPDDKKKREIELNHTVFVSKYSKKPEITLDDQKKREIDLNHTDDSKKPEITLDDQKKREIDLNHTDDSKKPE
eukprot:431523_1